MAVESSVGLLQLMLNLPYGRGWQQGLAERTLLTVFPLQAISGLAFPGNGYDIYARLSTTAREWGSGR